MSLFLVCAHPHAALPALTPGLVLDLCRTPTGELEVRTPGSPSVLSRIAQCIRDGALVLTGSDDPLYAEIEAMIAADRDRLHAKADAIMADLATNPFARAG